MAERLVALTTIRTDMGFTRYRPGDTLPADHPDAAAWVENGAAVWRDDDYTPPTWVKARMAAAEPGLGGIAVGGEATGGDLVGKVPRTIERTVPAWKR
jgi:hypothetical protein